MSKVRPFLDSTDVVGDTTELHMRFDRDGYLFIRGLLPVAVLDDLRQEFNKLLREAGWIAADAPLDDPIADLRAFAVDLSLRIRRSTTSCMGSRRSTPCSIVRSSWTSWSDCSTGR